MYKITSCGHNINAFRHRRIFYLLHSMQLFLLRICYGNFNNKITVSKVDGKLVKKITYIKGNKKKIITM